MKRHYITKNTLITAPIAETWNFFSDPRNLARITPPNMRFRILTADLADNIYTGMLIQYSVTPIWGITTKWLTEIKEVTEPNGFTDVQRKGPYARWIHRHSFEKHEKGTLMKDEIEYALPFSFVGEVGHWLFVGKRLQQIFDYREKVIEGIFKNMNNHG